MRAKSIAKTVVTSRQRRTGDSGSMKAPSKKKTLAKWTPKEMELALSGVDEWTPETFRMLQHLHGNAASERWSRSGKRKKSWRRGGAWSAVERRLFGNPDKHLSANRKYGRGFGASLMEGPNTDLFGIAGLPFDGELSDHLWDNHNWQSLLQECDEVSLLETGRDNMPRMSDSYYWAPVDDPAQCARQLREVIIRIALENRVP